MLRSCLWIFVLAASLIFVGCSAPTQSLPTTTLAASPTRGTDTPVFIPIDTPTPTLTPTVTVTPTPTPVVINLDNVTALLVGAVSVGAPATDLVWMPDGSALIVATDDGLRQISAQDGSLGALGTEQPVRAIVGGGEQIYAITNTSIAVVEVVGGAESVLLEGAFDALALSPDGAMLAAGDTGGTIHVIDTAAGTEVGKLVAGTVTSLAFSIDGSLLASSNVSNQVVLWEITDFRSLNTFASGALVQNLAISPDNILLAGSIGNQGVLWFVVSGDQVVTLNGHTRMITALAFHPSEAMLATGDQGGAIILWDFITGEAVTTLTSQGAGRISGVAWSADGSTLAAASEDGTVTIWTAGP